MFVTPSALWQGGSNQAEASGFFVLIFCNKTSDLVFLSTE